MAATWNFTIDQGATFQRTLTIRKNGVMFDLTGYTARMQVRRQAKSPDALLTLTDEDGEGLVMGGAAGTIGISISATATAALSFRAGVYDLELSQDGEVIRILEGIVRLKHEVTR